MNFDRLVEISKALKGKMQTGRAFHTTFVLSKSKVLTIGINDYTKTHPLTHEYTSRFANRHDYIAGLHSEISAITKMGEVEFWDYDFVNVRIMNTGELGMSRPCHNCHAIVQKYGYNKFYYSDEFGRFSRL
jgi:tRNA(Arg) A34 adenosine deaminase TadA